MSKNQVERYLDKVTQDAIKSRDGTLLETGNIANVLKLSRSTTSRYLNEGYDSGEFAKIQTHPVQYVSKKVLRENINSVKDDYMNFDEIFKDMNFKSNNSNIDVFDKVIGSDGSLINQIEEIKTATLYPGKGLPIMLMGPSGSGKTFLAHKIYDYCQEKKLISSKAKMQSLNCAQYFNNPELLSSLLFGYTKGAFTGAEKDTKGLIANADGGILFLDEVHRLTQSGQEKLFSFMDTGKYSPIGDDSIKRTANVRLIFATTETLDSTFLPTFIRRIPVIVNIPGFSDRPQNERVNLIDYFFMNESKVLKHELRVSNQLISTLASADMEGNIGKLKNLIKYSSGNAYAKLKNNSEIININMSNIPVNYYNSLVKGMDLKSESSEYVNYDYNKQDLPQHENKITNVLKKIYEGTIDLIWNYMNQKMKKDQLIERISRNVDMLFDSILFQTEYNTSKDSEYELLVYQIKSVFKFMEESYGYQRDGNQIISIATLLRSKNFQSVLQKNDIWQKNKNSIISIVKTTFEQSFQVSNRILTLLSDKMEREILDEDLLMVTLYVAKNSERISSSYVHSVILAHGYSTASSLANVANRMLKNNVFQAIDMPIDTTTKDIEAKLVDYINTVDLNKGLVLLIDMGSLNQLGNQINEKLNVPILIIDHVSTPVALNVGNMILRNSTMEDIGKKVKQENQLESKLLLPKEKLQKAIITCCHSGMGSAVQIQEIINNSLKKFNVDIQVIPYDYNKLSKNKRSELPFELYDVLAIVGTANPGINGIPYLSLDGLLSGEHIDELINILNKAKQMDYSELKDSLLINFTIKRMISSVSILNPNQLISLTDKTVLNMEKLMGKTFATNKRILLIIHEAGMVERIIRNEKLDGQPDLSEFMSRNEDLFTLVHHAIEPLEKHYNIKIGSDEIRLIIDIIMGDD
ncbi:sigma 54-interacting transcriptional regulator [Companilactobacillus hulinensis]|uniref:sigma 54-interacting transcriptional regulator n=1 Tax=Companilactobacillus hulinensis TaxID=2486007 RepID=UPI0013DE4197|nr:sigma 54-interacting transcriptional regulator [Companilactobacillus hulinensis]